MHFVFSKTTAVAGDWTGVVVPVNAWFTSLDQQLEKAINGDDGGTWAPGSAIVIGGAGMHITGPLLGLDNVTGNIQIANGGSITLANGAVVVAQAGSIFSWGNGAAIQMVTGSTFLLDGVMTVTTGFISLGAAADVTYSPARVVSKSGINLLWSTVNVGNLGSGPTYVSSFDAWTAGFTGTGGPPATFGPVVATLPKSVLAGEHFQLALPSPIPGATLTSVLIFTRGNVGNPTPTTYPTYLVSRVDATGNISSLKAGGAITDIHSTPLLWTTGVATTFTPDQNNTNIDPGTYTYVIDCTLPATSPGGPTQMIVYAVIANYSVPTLRM